ncbi:hypothetical protein ETB97_007074 [Aspergillus alliaceus]|uniref:Uncharacterized protein n=1 Tax=Petromyces alliaceus TaxID=209559 RepID=A0A8H5ZY96_PETAA|nr:hypothetical protein ETB97_007074 [Aspergillus burnettii]
MGAVVLFGGVYSQGEQPPFHSYAEKYRSAILPSLEETISVMFSVLLMKPTRSGRVSYALMADMLTTEETEQRRVYEALATFRSGCSDDDTEPVGKNVAAVES